MSLEQLADIIERYRSRSVTGPGTDRGELKPYQYLPLKQTEIRIIQIKPYHADVSQIECSMEHVSLETNDVAMQDWPEYLALSYAWGATSKERLHLTHGMNCNGKWLRVTGHLWNGLKRFQEFRSSRLSSGSLAMLPKDRIDYAAAALWVDAICINQNDDVEKSSQVQMMANIFSRAAPMILWLGDLQTAAPAFHREVQRFCESNRDDKEACSNWVNAVILIMRQSWFMRRWVCQEVAVTWKRHESAVILIGEHQLPLKKLTTEASKGAGTTDLDRVGICSSNGRRQYSLLERLRLHDGTECSDLHDIVYAVMHICSDIDRFALRVSYRQPVEDLFYGIAQTIMQNPISERETFALLALATAHPSPHEIVPSWAPDWSNESGFWCDEHRAVLYNDHFASSFGNPIRYRFELHGRFLIIQRELFAWPNTPSKANDMFHLPHLPADYRDRTGRPSQTPSREIQKSLRSPYGGKRRYVFRFGVDVDVPTFVLEQTSATLEGPEASVYRVLFCFLCEWKEPMVRSATTTKICIG